MLKEWAVWRGLYGDAQSLTPENRPSLYLEKRDFVTHHYTNLSQKTPKLGQIGCFFGQIFQNTPNFANWADWVWNGNPPIDIPQIVKNHLKNFAHPRIPFYSESPPPRGPTPASEFWGGNCILGRLQMPILGLPRQIHSVPTLCRPGSSYVKQG